MIKEEGGPLDVSQAIHVLHTVGYLLHTSERSMNVHIQGIEERKYSIDAIHSVIVLLKRVILLISH